MGIRWYLDDNKFKLKNNLCKNTFFQNYFCGVSWEQNLRPTKRMWKIAKNYLKNWEDTAIKKM